MEQALQEKELSRIIAEFVNALEKKISVTRVVLFGSYARGMAKSYSDIDLAVFSPDIGKGKRVDEIAFLLGVARTVNSRIEPIPFSDEELHQRDERRFSRHICKVGKVVFDSNKRRAA
ncbi:MAG: nucleotidyltransferase domain-containing protein [Deltaproteobacteria bacterium]|nr:nucleotidyltransferase domain-containing protein [Deltaproteobacteria bacterium]